MRHALIAVALALVAGLFSVASSSAAPASGQAISQITDHSSQIIHVRGGCGRGWHRGPHGHCRRNW